MDVDVVVAGLLWACFAAAVVVDVAVAAHVAGF